MRQQCGGPVAIHRRESESQIVSKRFFCHQIGTPASLLEDVEPSECLGRRGLEYCGDPPMSTLYHILGLPQRASREQVKTAFRTMARRFHPDVNAGNDAAEQRFKEVSKAYETLADPDARAAYDRALQWGAVTARRRRWTYAATAATTFALTISTIGLVLWWTQAMQGPEPMREGLPNAARRGPGVGAREAKQSSGAARGRTADLTALAASPEGRGRGSGWATYHNARFSFALKYPADVFTYDVGPSSENVRIFVSSDGGATLNIFAADNVSGTTLSRYRRSRMEERYAGAVFDQVPQRKFGFLLSGTQGGNVFYERVTFACGGRAIHGWQMIYPAHQRTIYDLVADEVDRTYTQNTRLGARCSERSMSTMGRRAREDTSG
jgi:curved DNA-binding protein CbpA